MGLGSGTEYRELYRQVGIRTCLGGNIVVNRDSVPGHSGQGDICKGGGQEHELDQKQQMVPSDQSSRGWRGASWSGS